MSDSSKMSAFAEGIMTHKYSHDLPGGGKESWEQIANRVVPTVFDAVGWDRSHYSKETTQAVSRREFLPGGRYLYATGRRLHQVQNCLLLRAHDSRQGWGDLMQNITLALMTGAGIGVDYSDLRPKNSIIRGTGGNSTGPLALMEMVNEAGRRIMQGGSRRSAIWAGLSWKHPDVWDFIHIKDWDERTVEAKRESYHAVAPMDQTNISVLLDDEFFVAYNDPRHPRHSHATDVFWRVIENMARTGEPGFSVDVGDNAGETLRNACTEVTSHDSDDICNLGSINLARVESISHMKELVELGVSFLTAGTVYSDVPYPDVDKVRTKNRRLGLGLMGIHEFLLKNGVRYGTPEAENLLRPYLEEYAKSTLVAWDIQDRLGLTRSVKTRAIAPTGTIGIVAETTTGIEPIFAAAYKRRYLVGHDLREEYVLDATAKRLVDYGDVDPESLEDAYSLAGDVGRRIRFQSFIQRYVDHGISSTINLPAWGSELNNQSTVRELGESIMRSLPGLRGITVYPDGARSGQPLTPVSYSEAAERIASVEASDVCDITKGGSCGD